MIEADRLKASIQRIVFRFVGHRLDYLAHYWSTVVAQNGDMTLDVRCDDERIGDLVRVPMRLGIPGSTAVVNAGARVLLGFVDADPQRPFVSFFAAGGLKELRLGNGTAAVARVGDPVVFTLPAAVPITGTCPAGPFTGVLTIPPTPVRGKITTGSTVVKSV